MALEVCKRYPAHHLGNGGYVCKFQTMFIYQRTFVHYNQNLNHIAISAEDFELFSLPSLALQGSSIILSLAPIVRQYTSQHSGKDSWLFFVSMFMMYSVGYPIGHTALIGLFSKVIGKRPQV